MHREKLRMPAPSSLDDAKRLLRRLLRNSALVASSAQRVMQDSVLKLADRERQVLRDYRVAARGALIGDVQAAVRQGGLTALDPIDTARTQLELLQTTVNELFENVHEALDAVAAARDDLAALRKTDAAAESADEFFASPSATSSAATAAEAAAAPSATASGDTEMAVVPVIAPPKRARRAAKATTAETTEATPPPRSGGKKADVADPVPRKSAVKTTKPAAARKPGTAQRGGKPVRPRTTPRTSSRKPSSS